MKRLAIVGIVLAGVFMSASIAQAKPAGMSNAEYQALMIRSQGLNQKYGAGQKSQQAFTRSKLEEIGAWAVPSSSAVPVRPSVPAQEAITRGKHGELEGLGALPSKPAARVTAGGDGFDWNNAGIGAAFVLGAVMLGAASVATRRRHHRPVAH